MADHVHNEDWSDLEWATHLAESHDDKAAIPGLNLIMAVGGEWSGIEEHARLHASTPGGVYMDEDTAEALGVRSAEEQAAVDRALHGAVLGELQGYGEREPGSLNLGAIEALTPVKAEDVEESGVFPIVSDGEREFPGTGVPLGEGIEVPIGETATLSAEDDVQDGWGLAGTGPVLLPEEESMLRTGEGAQFLIPWANAREAGLAVYFRSGLRPWARPFADGAGCAIVTEVPAAVVAAVQAALRRAAALFENGAAAVYVWEPDLPEPRTETVTEELAKALESGKAKIPGYAVQSVEYRRDGSRSAVVTLLPVEPDPEASPDPAEVHADDEEVDRLLAEVEGRTRAAMAEGEPDPRGYGIGQMGGLPDDVAPSRGAPLDGAEALQALRRYRDEATRDASTEPVQVGAVVHALIEALRPMVEFTVEALDAEALLPEDVQASDAVAAVLSRWEEHAAAALPLRQGAPSPNTDELLEAVHRAADPDSYPDWADPTATLNPGDHYTAPQ